MALVISLGGSLITRDYSLLDQYAEVIKKLQQHYGKIYVVTGGGKLARELISQGKKLNFNNEQLDWIGIYATRIHALMLYFALGINKEKIAFSVDELLQDKQQIYVMGGVKPGQSTDAVAAEIALKINASYLINATNVQGVYDKDPRKYSDAKLLRKLCYDELLNIIKGEKQVPGNYALFDLRGLMMLRNSNTILKILDATNPYALLKFKELGTEVKRC